MKVGSLFAGIGGFDLALERSGMEIAFQCEIEPNARKVLNQHWPNVPCYEDVSLLNKETLGGSTVDVLCGGPPCQDLSVAGKRAGLAGARSGLFHQFMRITDELAPRWVLIENVPGLLNSNGGRDMGTVLGTLADLGYGWAYRVLDAQYFGLPQRRKRVFIVGCAGNPGSAARTLFEPGCSSWDHPERPKEGQISASRPSISPPTGSSLEVYRKTRRAQSTEDHEAWLEDGVANTLSGFDYGGPARSPQAIVTEAGVRRLLPIEAERLQGFPDHWTASVSSSNRYRFLGNAVSVPVAEWIAKRLHISPPRTNPAA